MKRKVPYAVGNFQEIRRDNYYFVDKTAFLRELENWKVPVMLRPRRFGKSLWCSIIEHYYDIRFADDFDALFGGLDIGNDPTPLRNGFLVMRFDFSVIDVQDTHDLIERNFADNCDSAFRQFLQDHGDRLGLKPEDLSQGTPTAKLQRILDAVRQQAVPAYIVIDEYDNFTNQLIIYGQEELYRKITTGDSFLRAFFKTIKAGLQSGLVGRVYITGVLPVTMDDLTSGFNVVQYVTLKPQLLNMMGFTQKELERYVEEIFADHGFDAALRTIVMRNLRDLYNGYRFLPNAKETLYNSTISNFYLSELVTDRVLPQDPFDPNLSTDIGWIRSLTRGDDNARALVRALVLDGSLPINMDELRTAFSMRKFFEPAHFPLSLYYLGMVTFLDGNTLVFPNLSMRVLFGGYFKDLEKIDILPANVLPAFRKFTANGDLAVTFQSYWENHVKQIPAQAFDQINENFFRTTYYMFFRGYTSTDYTTMIEANLPNGRADFMAVPYPGSEARPLIYLLEFKYHAKSDKKKPNLPKLTAPLTEDIAQIDAYAASIALLYPTLPIRRHLCYIVAAQKYKWFTLD